jgi:hypothetical protein
MKIDQKYTNTLAQLDDIQQKEMRDYSLVHHLTVVKNATVIHNI